MEKSFLLLKPHGRKMCRGAETVGLIALGGLGALSGIYGASTASSNNAAMLSANKEMQKDAQRWNEKMYQQQLADQESMYNKYQSPQAIADQLRQAGLNPSALASDGLKGGIMPSVPSAGSSPALSSPTLENEGSYIQNAISSTSSALGSLASAKAASAEADSTRKLLSSQMAYYQRMNNKLEQEAISKQLENTVYKELGRTEVASRIMDNFSTAYLQYCTGDVQGALKKYYDIQTDIGKEEYKITKEKAANISGLINRMMLNLEQEFNLKGSQISLNYGNARLSNERAATEKELRPYKKVIERANAYVAQATSPSKIKQVEQDVIKSKWFNELLKNQNLQVIIENRDKEVYNSFQRLLHGKSQSGDAMKLLKALSALDAEMEVTLPD